MNDTVKCKFSIGQVLWWGKRLRMVKVYGHSVQESYNTKVGPFLITYMVSDLETGEHNSVPQWELFVTLDEAVGELMKELKRLVTAAEDAGSSLKEFCARVDSNLKANEKEQ